jgi:hypothetical protein
MTGYLTHEMMACRDPQQYAQEMHKKSTERWLKMTPPSHHAPNSARRDDSLRISQKEQGNEQAASQPIGSNRAIQAQT